MNPYTTKNNVSLFAKPFANNTLFTSKAAVLALTLAFVGCQKQESNLKKQTEPTIPTQLELTVRQASRPLTKTEIQTIKSTFAQRQRIDLPGNLLLAERESKMTEAELNEFVSSEQSFKFIASPESWEMYQALRSNCSKNRLESKTEISVPLERIKSLDDVRANDRFLANLMMDYTGKNCMVNAKMGYEWNTRVERMEPDALVSSTASSSLSALLNNNKFAQMLNSRGFAVTSRVSMLVGKIDPKSTNFEDVRGHYSFVVSGSYYTAQHEIPFSMQVQLLASTNRNKDIFLDMTQNLLIKMPNFDVSIDMEIETEQPAEESTRLVKQRYFINGQEMTVPEIEELFGSALKHEKSIKSVRAILN